MSTDLLSAERPGRKLVLSGERRERASCYNRGAPSMTVPLFLFLWWLSIAVKLVAQIRMSFVGLVKYYPLCALYLSVSVVRSTVGACIWLRPSYANWFASTSPILLGLAGVAAVSVYYVTVSEYPNFRTVGFIILVVALLFGTQAAVFFGGPRVPISAAWKLAEVVQRYSSTAMLLGCVMVYFSLPRNPLLPIPRHAKWAAVAVLIEAAGWLASSVTALDQALTHTWWPYLLPIATGTITGGIWLFCPSPRAVE